VPAPVYEESLRSGDFDKAWGRIGLRSVDFGAGESSRRWLWRAASWGDLQEATTDFERNRTYRLGVDLGAARRHAHELAQVLARGKEHSSRARVELEGRLRLTTAERDSYRSGASAPASPPWATTNSEGTGCSAQWRSPSRSRDVIACADA